jgi:uncharacterized protein YceK
MRKMQEWIVLVIVVLLFLSGCSPVNSPPPPMEGQIVALSIRSTLWGIGQAWNEASGTVRLLDPTGQKVLLGWSLKNSYAFVCMDGSGLTCSDAVLKLLTTKGNIVNPKDIGGVVKVLEEQGWAKVSSADLPAYIQATVTAASSITVQLSQSLTTFLIAPAGMFSPEFILDETEGPRT